MNSQQELLDAINTISQSKDRSCDTPATVLRVEGDTVWVHIDGGADETPVQKTINCEQGETVQVRISNGSAFLVGNASAPPTDDKTANVAHFIAEEADIKAVRAENTAVEAHEAAEAAQAAVAQSLTTYETWYLLSATTPTQPTEDSHTGWSTTEPAWSSSSTDDLYFSVRTVKGDGTITWSAVGMVQSYADLQILKNAIISTVASDYVAQGGSNVTTLSSTMLQNANGVNIYNNTLAVGDSYAHIDGDSFDIREATSAGVIDDANDITLATFGANETVIGLVDVDGYRASIKDSGIKLIYETFDPSVERGWSITADQIKSYGLGVSHQNKATLAYDGITFSIPPGDDIQYGKYLNNYAELYLDEDLGDTLRTKIESGEINVKNETYINQTKYTQITPEEVKVYSANSIYQTTDYTDITPGLIENTGDVKIGGEVKDLNGARKYVAEPSSEGTNGQVLTTDGAGGRTWTTVSGGGPTVLTSTTISAATTSYTFSNAAIKTTSIIDIYDTIFGFAPTGMTVSNGSATITFPAQSSSHTIKLFVY